MAEPFERNLGFDRANETAAMGAARWMGRATRRQHFAATGIATSEYLQGIDFSADGAVTIR